MLLKQSVVLWELLVVEWFQALEKLVCDLELGSYLFGQFVAGGLKDKTCSPSNKAVFSQL